MKCPKCAQLNEDDALYCNKCGQPLAEKKKDWPSILLLAYCCSLLFFAVLHLILNLLLPKLGLEPQTYTIIYNTLGIIQTLLCFVIPLGIRTTWIKITAFAVVAIVVGIYLFGNISGIISAMNFATN